jgi:hypothetical protein
VTQVLHDQTPPPHPAEPAGRSTGKPWYARKSVRAATAGALVIGVAVAAGLGGGKDSTPTGATTASGSHQTSQPSGPARSAEELKKDATAQDRQATREDAQGDGSVAKAVPSGTWLLGSVGTYLVGRGIRPGTYRSAAPASGLCHWSRLSGLSDAPADVIADRSVAGPSTVKIKASDKFFLTSNCANWQKIH